MTSSSSLGFVLFQIFLMTARSSLLATSRFPGGEGGRGGGDDNTQQGIQGCPHPDSSHPTVPWGTSGPPQFPTFRLDLEGSAHQGEEGGVEGHGPVRVERHVHGHQALGRGERVMGGTESGIQPPPYPPPVPSGG